jgi:hypothetical protein
VVFLNFLSYFPYFLKGIVSWDFEVCFCYQSKDLKCLSFVSIFFCCLNSVFVSNFPIFASRRRYFTLWVELGYLTFCSFFGAPYWDIVAPYLEFTAIRSSCLFIKISHLFLYRILSVVLSSIWTPYKDNFSAFFLSGATKIAADGPIAQLHLQSKLATVR